MDDIHGAEADLLPHREAIPACLFLRHCTKLLLARRAEHPVLKDETKALLHLIEPSFVLSPANEGQGALPDGRAPPSDQALMCCPPTMGADGRHASKAICSMATSTTVGAAISGFSLSETAPTQKLERLQRFSDRLRSGFS